LGVILDEADVDYGRLAIRALEAMIEAGEETLRRDRGAMSGQTRYLSAAREAMQAGTCVAHVTQPRQITPFRQHADKIDAAAGMAALGLAAPKAAAPASATRSPAPAPPAPQLPQGAPQKDAAAGFVSETCEPSPLQARTSAAKTAKAGTASGVQDVGAEYISLRCEGYAKFKRTETPCQKSGQSWKKNSAPNVKSTINLLAKGLPVSDLADVTEAMLTEFWALVPKLPRSYADDPKERRNLKQIVADTDAQDAKNAALIRARLEKEGASPGKIEFHIAIGKSPRMRVATVYRHMQDAQRICKFAVAKGYLDGNIMEDHIWDKRAVARRELHQEDNKREAWFDDLPALLRSPVFQKPLDEPGDPLFWAPLIALHAGLRSEECLQLATNDIRDVEGIPCFVLQKGVEQNLKSEAARRIVPVHQSLIDLGLLELVALRKRDAEPRLFPWLQRSAAKKTFTENFSKTFTAYRKKINVYKAGLDFHAFRTTFNQSLISLECPDSQRKYMLGHSENDIGIKHYAPDGFPITRLRNRVNQVTYDISMVRQPFQERIAGGITDLAAHRQFKKSS
jgi:integrase